MLKAIQIGIHVIMGTVCDIPFEAARRVQGNDMVQLAHSGTMQACQQHCLSSPSQQPYAWLQWWHACHL